MGRKYIIEIIGGEEGDMDFSTIEPYTEPDLERVRKEAYEQGRKVGIKDGMCKAWETAKKVTYVSKYGGYGDCLDKVFDRHDGDAWDVFDYSPTEVIEKIRAYEKEKEEQIQVGDEVIRHYKNEFMEGDDVPSIFLSEEDGHFRCLAFNGRSIMIAEYPKNQYRKTGRHFPEIAEVLQKMKES